jgi:hypothetical protein
MEISSKSFSDPDPQIRKSELRDSDLGGRLLTGRPDPNPDPDPT